MTRKLSKGDGRMKAVAFLAENAVADRIIEDLKPTLAAEKLEPYHVFEQVTLTASGESGEYS